MEHNIKLPTEVTMEIDEAGRLRQKTITNQDLRNMHSPDCPSRQDLSNTCTCSERWFSVTEPRGGGCPEDWPQYTQAVPVPYDPDKKDVAAAIDRLTERLSDILSGMYDMQVDIRDALRELNLREKNRG